jgi:hypothetical protein
VGDGFETLFNTALQGALKSISSGATVGEARKQLQVALNAGGADPVHIKDFLVRFDNMHLDKPENVHAQLVDQINKALLNNGADQEKNIVSSQQSNWFKAAWDSHFGNAATDQARAAASAGAKVMVTAFYDAMKTNDIDAERDAITTLQDGLNSMFETTFDGFANDSGYKDTFKQLGIKTMDDLWHTWDDAVRNGAKAGSPAAALTRFVADNPELEDSLNAYGELWKKTLDQIGGAMGKSGDELTTWESHMHTWGQVVQAMGGPMETLEQAQTNYNKALDDYKSSHAGTEMPDNLKLMALNAERAKLGLDETTNLLDMFTVASGEAANGADGAARAFNTMAEALDTSWAMDNLAGSDYANMMKDAMSGAADYVYQTAQKGAERAEKAKEKAIQDGGQRQVDALKKQEKAVQDQYDINSKALQDQNDKDKKAIEDKYKALADMYDADIKQAEDAAKAKTDAIQDEINALQKDDEARQKLFQNETNRIERMAQMQNSSIDFNSAMNSGNIDEAAKIMNNASAQQTGWMLQDQQAKMDDASKAQQDNLQAQIEAINAEKDAYVQAMQDKKSALDDQKQAELDALDTVYQANKDKLDKEKQDTLDALQAQEDAVQKDTQAKLAYQQQRYQDAIDKINLELETLKASVPKNAAEVQALADNVRAKYKALGIDLENVSGAWTGDLGVAIAQNIDRARLSAADGQAWQQVGKFIADQISAGSGFSIDQVLTYLRTGAWPDAPSKCERRTEADSE